MTSLAISRVWGERFGLARSPLFDTEKGSDGGTHEVLLDGGFGSFGLSLVDELPEPKKAAGWAWSSDLPHHVTIAKNVVQVVRWDDARDPQKYSLESVQRDLDGFYRYLCRDRLRSNRTVVRHLVNLYGRIRSLTAHHEIPDERSIDAFLTILADLVAGEVADTTEFGLCEDANDLRNALQGHSLDEALREIRTAPDSLAELALNPSLAIRHASGQLFQEAHFDLVRAPAPDLFGYVDPAVAKRKTRGGTHFTPPALARSIVDHTLAQMDDLSKRENLTVTDPACGSGAFLHEALRGLRREGFAGSLSVVGQDLSDPAIAMARFTLKLALRDWQPQKGASLDLKVTDSLAEPSFPEADVTVMNPPFISVIAQTTEQKTALREIVGSRAGSRGDYSMAFITRALDALKSGGAMGTLFPANLLTHDAVVPWRSHLAEKGDVRLLASIGDFGLFSQALVHVACAVIVKGEERAGDFTALITENESGATGDALRELRKFDGKPPNAPIDEENWKLFSASKTLLGGRMPWRILTPAQRQILDSLEAVQTPRVEDLFEISQGVQTGNLKLFLFDEAQFSKLGLPTREKAFFRRALMTDSISNGTITKEYFMFFPHGEDGALFEGEDALAKAVPTYYRKVLKPSDEVLRSRASIVRSRRSDWWGLMHPRIGGFASSEDSRIVSKFFGAEGSFVLDANAHYLPSTGHVWIPKSDTTLDNGDVNEAATREGLQDAITLEVLRAYVTLLNSRCFVRLVSFRSVTVAGGQYDLSRRFISRVHIPNLWDKSSDPVFAKYIRELARLHSSENDDPVLKKSRVDLLVSRLYGVPELAED